MKHLDDLLTAVARMRDHYERGRIDREIMRQWVLGLGGYPAPYGARVDAAKAWFKHQQPEITGEVRAADLERLKAILG